MRVEAELRLGTYYHYLPYNFNRFLLLSTKTLFYLCIPFTFTYNVCSKNLVSEYIHGSVTREALC